jgi:hypothetical protein
MSTALTAYAASTKALTCAHMGWGGPVFGVDVPALNGLCPREGVRAR